MYENSLAQRRCRKLLISLQYYDDGHDSSQINALLGKILNLEGHLRLNFLCHLAQWTPSDANTSSGQTYILSKVVSAS